MAPIWGHGARKTNAAPTELAGVGAASGIAFWAALAKIPFSKCPYACECSDVARVSSQSMPRGTQSAVDRLNPSTAQHTARPTENAITGTPMNAFSGNVTLDIEWSTYCRIANDRPAR
jgi:hypothetical protein